MCQSSYNYSSEIRIVKLIKYQSNLENVKQKNTNIKNAMSAENVVKKNEIMCHLFFFFFSFLSFLIFNVIYHHFCIETQQIWFFIDVINDDVSIIKNSNSKID